jgi:hypothetical protein
MLRQVPTLILVICTASGCSASRTARRAQQNERAGRYHLAYDLYCQAAEKQPSSRSFAAGIARVAPGASRYWENRAHQALQAGDCETAWKHLMHVLTIRPDHPSAAELIRKLERDHPDQIADAHRAYLLGGQTALVVKGPPPVAPGRQQRPPGDQVALGDDGAAQPMPEPDEPPESSPAARTPAGSERPLQPKPGSQQTAEPSEAGRRRAPSEHRPAPRPAGPHDSDGSYLVIATVSRKDRRFRKLVETIDDIFVEVKDTDPEPDADMHVYLGRERIKKVKNWRPQHRVRVEGRSGRPYEIVILRINHATETVRFGVRAAR